MSKSNKRPAPADAKLVAGLARDGPIGQCLRQALHDFVSESFVNQVEEDVNEGVTKEQDGIEHVLFDSDMAERVVIEFGCAVAKSDWKDCPTALLRGRVDHYNKIESKWRIVVEDAEIRPRIALGNGRKRQKISLWEQANQGKEAREQSVCLSGPLQLLAYDDL